MVVICHTNIFLFTMLGADEEKIILALCVNHLMMGNFAEILSRDTKESFVKSKDQ